MKRFETHLTELNKYPTLFLRLDASKKIMDEELNKILLLLRPKVPEIMDS